MEMDNHEVGAVFASLYMSAAMCLILSTKLKKKKTRRRFWVRNIFQNRDQYGYNNSLLRELRSHDQEYYFEFMRMSPAVFDWLLERVSPLIEKKYTFWRKPISANTRLALTLRFLATGETLRSLSLQFRVGRQTLSDIIPETCAAIWDCFVKEFMNFPDSPDGWLRIAHGFAQKWQLPHCCGALDGKHVLRECPPNTGSLNFNYKGTYSSVLMALADADYRFIMIDYGHYGSESDGGIFRKSTLGKRLVSNALKLPSPTALPNSQTVMPYFFVGDEAFPLGCNLLRPFPRSQLARLPRIFNYRLSRARRVVENAFGILSARFRVFKRALNYSDSTTEKIVLAACVLHNILIEKSPAYCPAEFGDLEDSNHQIQLGDWRKNSQSCLNELGKFGSNMYSQNARSFREAYMKYLVNEGAVSWQDEIIHYQ